MRPRPIAARGALAFAATTILTACSEDSPLVGPERLPERPTASLTITASPANTAPELPRTFLNTTYVAPTGKTITVRAGEGLQSAINAAVPGDVILLQAGATFTSNYYLPKKSGTGWVTIRTSTSDASLPQGVRVGPADAFKMARLMSPNAMATLRTSDGAHHYRLIGLEISAPSSLSYHNGLVNLGTGHEDATTELPSSIILDRTYIHGPSTLTLKRCVALNGISLAIIDSYVSGCHSNMTEAKAIAAWNGPGPLKIVNNYLEGSGEGILFGGADPLISNVVPSDVEIRRNHITRPASWKYVWTVKNLVELKNARRLLIEGNVFENNWADAQTGFAFVWKSVNQSGRCTWCTVQDITFRYNKVRRTPGVFTISAKAGSYPAVNAARIRIEHNLLTQLDTLTFTGSDRVFQFQGALTDITIDHNTVAHRPHYFVMWASGTMSRLEFRNTIADAGAYGIKGDATPSGTPTLEDFTYSYTFPRNVFVKTNWSYPSTSYYPTTVSGIGFVNAAGGNYRLASTSPYKGKATDGTDPGANIDLLEQKTAGVVK